MNENLFATKVYENITTFRLRQIKPKQTQSNPISKVKDARISKEQIFHLKGKLYRGRILKKAEENELQSLELECENSVQKGEIGRGIG
jgi:hypothetical protein